MKGKTTVRSERDVGSAKVIGEQKFGVECDSPKSERIGALEERYGVPVLLHFEQGRQQPRD